MRKALIVLALFFVFLAAGKNSLAQEVIIAYTGDTHAALYPCACPIEKDGGVARRAHLLKQLRRKYPNLLLLDSGNFFGAGLLDQNTQGTSLDMQRTLVNLRAIEAMQYDALNLGEDEFNFGEGFLEEQLDNFKIEAISSNVKSGKFPPFIIKDVSGIRFCIIGLADKRAKAKLKDLSFVDPKEALKQVIPILKEKGADIIVLLSNLSDEENVGLVNAVGGIDIVVGRHEKSRKTSPTGEKAVMLRPSWQGRRIGKLTLRIEDKKILGVKIEEIRLSDQIPDDAKVKALLPACFSDRDCEKPGPAGTCLEAGSLKSRCLYKAPVKVIVDVITYKDCAICNTAQVIDSLRNYFPLVVPKFTYYPGRKAASLIKESGVSGLPAYIFSKDIEKDSSFGQLKDNLLDKGRFYVLKPEASGIAYLLNRKEERGRFDVFLSLFDDASPAVLEAVKEFSPHIHFLGVFKKGKFDAPKGNMEVEEDLRAVCVKKHYPEKFNAYIVCRSENILSSWWEDCLLGTDIQKVKSCARSEEGASLLKENIRLNNELKIMFGPTYLLNNQEIFGSKGAPHKEELKKIIKR